MQTIFNFLENNKIGDLASILGVFIALIGFSVTIVNAIRSRRAAQQAEVAANTVRDRLAEASMIADLSSAIAILEEIRRLHRQAAWQVLPDRYSQLKKALISIKALYVDLGSEHQTKIQAAIQQVTTIEFQVEKNIDEKSRNRDGALDVPKLNRVITKQIDKLTELIISIQHQVGG